MSRVDADPKELRAFASALKSAEADIESLNSKVNGALSRVSNSWRDPQQRKAQDAIKAATAQSKRFKQEIESIQQYCTKLAAHLENVPR
jgi:uncharacterized protein YukE